MLFFICIFGERKMIKDEILNRNPLKKNKEDFNDIKET